MKVQSLKLKAQRSASLYFALMLLFTVCCLLPFAVAASEKWPGVDETVVERIAQQHGREAKEPLINTDQGDLLLFVFLIAGVAGGFGAGYYWRMLLEGRAPASPQRTHEGGR